MTLQDFVYIQADSDCEEEDALVDFFAGAYENGKLSDAMDLDADPTDSRLITDSVEIISVTSFEDAACVEITYEVSASCFYACADQSRDISKSFTIKGKLENGFWKFPRHIKPEQRSTHEEY